MSEKQSTGDWYCRNCGYLSGRRVTNHETCDTCHIPVEYHSATQASALTLALAEIERLRKALEEIEAMHGKDMCDRESDRDLGWNDALRFVRDIALAALTPPAKEVPSE